MGGSLYEERITLWHTDDFDEALELASRATADYAADTDGVPTDLHQAYLLYDELEEGAEVFSLIRRSSLDAAAYLDRYFDVGTEHRGVVG